MIKLWLTIKVNLNETWAEEEMMGMKRVEVKQSQNMVDKETQIYTNDPHLFVFDDEVSITIIIIWYVIVLYFRWRLSWSLSLAELWSKAWWRFNKRRRFLEQGEMKKINK